MIEQSYANRLAGLGEWTPGAREIERFREDLYLRIVGTAETMNRILDEEAETVLSALRRAAAGGNLDEERMEFELGTVSDSVENSRFAYNWAHVMLTTRVLDAIKTWSSQLVCFVPEGKPYNPEVDYLRSEFVSRFKIDFSGCSTGDSFLIGMILARNKIVHNRAMAWKQRAAPMTFCLSERSGLRSPKIKILSAVFLSTLTALTGSLLVALCSTPMSNWLWRLSHGLASRLTHSFD